MCPFERQIKSHLPMDLKFWINHFISFLMPVRWANNRLSEFPVPNRNWYIQVTWTLIQHRIDLRLKVFITLFNGLICGYLVFPGYPIPPPNSDLLPGAYMITKACSLRSQGHNPFLTPIYVKKTLFCLGCFKNLVFYENLEYRSMPLYFLAKTDHCLTQWVFHLI